MDSDSTSVCLGSLESCEESNAPVVGPMDSDSASVRLGSLEDHEDSNAPIVGPMDSASVRLGSLENCKELRIPGVGPVGNLGGMVMVCLEELEEANPFLLEFCDLYLLFHGMVSKNEIFKHLPLLSCVECLVRQIVKAVDPKKPQCLLSGSLIKEEDPYDALKHLLTSKELDTKRICGEINVAANDWRFIRKLAREQTVSVEDVERAASMRGFNTRLLSLILYKLSQIEVNEIHMMFLSVSGVLSGINDDLCTYEEDVYDYNMNILCLFVRAYGSSEAAIEMVKYIQKLEGRQMELQMKFDAELSTLVDKHMATKGNWSMPSIIKDEDAYRAIFSEP